jgi:hypothetical protein
MKQELERMVDVLNEADTKSARPIASYVLRMYLARTLVGPREMQDVLQRAERIDPRNSIVKGAFIRGSTPKWGGDVAALERLVREVQASSHASDLKAYVRYEREMSFADDRKLGKSPEDAIAAYERAAKLCPAFPKPYENLLQLYKDTDDAQGVVTAAQRYLEINPASGWAYTKLGSAQARMKRDDESFHSYERASQLGERTGTEGLAWHYARGAAVPRNPAKALELYQVVYDRGGTHVAPQIERLRQELRR